MEQNANTPFFLEKCFDFAISKARKYWIPLFSSFLFGLLAYGFFLTNKLVNHDEVFYLFEKGGTTILGRWGLDICERIFPNISMPWIYGIISIALIAVSVCIMIYMFGIKSKLLQVLMAGTVVVFPSLTATLTYTFTVSSFCLSFLMAVIAVALLKNPSRLKIVLALGCMIFSLSIYQSYISLAAGLLVLILIQELMQEADMAAIFKKGVGYVLFLIVSVVGYYIATLLVQKILGIAFGAYANQYMTFRFSEIPQKIVLSYKSFFQLLFGWPNWLIPALLARRLNYVFLIVLAAMFLVWSLTRSKAEWLRILFLAALIGILPLAIDCMYLVTPPEAIHALVMYGFVCFYILVIVLANQCMSIAVQANLLHRLRSCCVNIVFISLSLLLLSNIYTANAVSLNLHLQYENTYAFYTSLISDIKMMPEFDENTKLAIIGEYQCPEFHDRYLFEARSLVGAVGFCPDHYSKAEFMEYYIGFPIPFASDDEIDLIKATSEFAQMPVYPYYGSMKMIDGILTVKLS